MSWPGLNYKPLYLFTLLSGCLLLEGGCFNQQNRLREKPVARVFNEYLYPDDLSNIVPSGTNSADSTMIAKSYIQQWIRKKVLLKKAEFNLSNEKQNVDQLIEEYRASLLIYEYEKEYLLQKMDTVVSDNEIETFYTHHPGDFRLDGPIIKGLYFTVPSNSDLIRTIRKILPSKKSEDYTRLVALAGESALLIEPYEEQWVSFSVLCQRMPHFADNTEDYLKKHDYIEVADSSKIHFIKVLEYKLSGETAPLEYVRSEVNDVILNRRKVKVIHQLESSIYDEAVLQNQIEIYEN